MESKKPDTHLEDSFSKIHCSSIESAIFWPRDNMHCIKPYYNNTTIRNQTKLLTDFTVMKISFGVIVVKKDQKMGKSFLQIVNESEELMKVKSEFHTNC